MAWTPRGWEPPAELYALWQAAVARSRAAVTGTLDHGGLDQLAHWTSSSGQSPSLRRILINLIEEYGRHNGHADLLREAVGRPHRRGSPG